MKDNRFRTLICLVTLFSLIWLAGCAELAGAPAATDVPEESAESAQPIISATGVVVPEQWANLSLPGAGIIETVMVKEGDAVLAGQALMSLRGKETAQAALTAAQLENTSAQIAFDALYRNLELDRAEAHRAVAEAEKVLDKAEKRLNSKEYQRGDADQVDIARANYVIAEEAVEDAEELYDQVDDRADDDPVRAEALSQLAAARQRRDTALYNLNYLMARPNSLDVADIDTNVELARANLAEAQRKYNCLLEGPDPDQLKIAEARLANAQNQVAAAQQALADLVLTAPFDGTVTRLLVRPNEWIAPGQTVILLANLSGLHVETTDLNEIDVAQLNEGATVIMTFDALPDLVVNGTIKRIANKASEGSGVNYTVVIEMDEIPPRLRWGMTAFVDIPVSK
jgi:HlyD family secretion protein